MWIFIFTWIHAVKFFLHEVKNPHTIPGLRQTRSGPGPCLATIGTNDSHWYRSEAWLATYGTQVLSCIGQWSQISSSQLNKLADVYCLEILYGFQISGCPWKLRKSSNTEPTISHGNKWLELRNLIERPSSSVPHSPTTAQPGLSFTQPMGSAGRSACGKSR